MFFKQNVLKIDLVFMGVWRVALFEEIRDSLFGGE